MEEVVDEKNRQLARKVGSERLRLQLQLESVQAIESNKTGYPIVPKTTRIADRKGTGLPKRPGVYFVWNNGIVVYVGLSECLKNRAVLGRHENIFDGDELSWLEWPSPDLKYAESYYIGICRPQRNFGKAK